MAPRRTARNTRQAKPDTRPRAGGDLVPAAEYARAIGVVKSRMSAWFAQGMPYIDGKDAEGRRDCKLVDLAEADTWRMANTDVRVSASGELRGLNMASDPSGSVSPNARAAPAAGEGVPSRPVDKGAAGGETAPPPQAPAPAAASAPAEMTAQQIATARIAESKAAGVEADTRMKILRMQAAEGALLDRKAAIGAHLGFVQRVGVAIDRMPVDCAALVAARLGVSEHEVFKALKDVVVIRMREDLARDARSSAEAAKRAKR